ncbi:PREDICTED: uncharacterized protein LOC107193292 [Dufourea novaeangliae]|uniref:CHK kinase-like domain-containing protein n=1 Tax=Dufourea novaeangliae TaxID=178035 RepID=A0A154NZB0_DUFNO|nr:PREDICTED: uncharacterized protein LOC107193292 [Dufourea novaeangliae]KZC04967.1 hypothetical protein WN55_09766 [Dufourea novaeangliae]
MTKDYGKLKDVSEHFTENKLQEILLDVHKGQKANVLNWYFNEASAKGDNYLSTVNKIKIVGNVDGKEVQVSLVVKSLPNNIGRRNTYRSVEFFRNEILFYTKVVPKFQEFLESKGHTEVLCIPHHLASVMDGINDYIALEDVTPLGYRPICRQNCINANQCAMILRTVARFHAISFAYKDQKTEDFKEISENVNETYLSDDHWNWYKRFHQRVINIAKNALAMEYPGSKAEKRFNSYEFGVLYQKVSEFCNRKYHPTSIITQGDSWVPNFLTKDTDGTEALMLDFQLARCSSPVLDISMCIYGCTEKSLWDEHFDKLLKLYYDELSKTISLLGSNPENLYPWSTFMKEVKEQFIFGVVLALEMIPFSLLDESESFDLDAIIKNDQAVDVDDVWTVSNIKTQNGRLRLANVIAHAVENGFL